MAANIEDDFGLSPGALYSSGMLLTRLKADFAPGPGKLNPDPFEMNASHVYWNAHVDKANIASYDYSALLYLNGRKSKPPIDTSSSSSRKQGAPKEEDNQSPGGMKHEGPNFDFDFSGGELTFIDEDEDVRANAESKLLPVDFITAVCHFSHLCAPAVNK